MSRLVDLSSGRGVEANDIPLLIKSAERIDLVPAERLITLATVVDLTRIEDWYVIDRDELVRTGVAGISGCILHTNWCDDYLDGEGYSAPVLSVEAAGYLLEGGVRTVAADFPIVGAAADLLLANGCVLVYCLSNIDEVSKPIVRLEALPEIIQDGRCVHARVIAIEE